MNLSPVVKKRVSKSLLVEIIKIDGDKATRIKKNCSRCGKGVFMSEHKDRNTCGKCGLTEFKQ